MAKTRFVKMVHHDPIEDFKLISEKYKNDPSFRDMVNKFQDSHGKPLNYLVYSKEFFNILNAK